MTLSKEDRNKILGLIAMFTAERPMVVHPATYALLKHEGLVDERIILSKDVSTGVNGVSSIFNR